MPWPTDPVIGQTYQPAGGSGSTYVYRGGQRWDVQSPPDGPTLADYYTKTEEDAAHTALSNYVDETVGDLAAEVESTFTPLAALGANNGVATLDGEGKVPTGQLALAKTLVGLDNVDNTSDADKPISDATAAALLGKAASTHGHAMSEIVDLVTTLAAKLNSSGYTAADVLAKLLTVDGPASGVNADLLDNFHASSFVRTVNALSPDVAGNVTLNIGRMSHGLTPGNDSQTAPSGSTYWNGSATPTTSMRRRVDNVTVAHAATASNNRLKITYQAQFAIAQTASTEITESPAPLAVALFRDSNVNAIEWIPVSSMVRDLDQLIASAMATFLVAAPDTSTHTYRVAIISGAVGGSPYDVFDAAELTRRTLLIEEFNAGT
jgi:hypothetical protein